MSLAIDETAYKKCGSHIRSVWAAAEVVFGNRRKAPTIARDESFKV